MKRKLSLGLMASALILGGAATAADDSCDDYFMRHNKADLVPVGIRAANLSNQVSTFEAISILLPWAGALGSTKPRSGPLSPPGRRHPC